MYACLYAPQAASLVADQQALFALAEAFSPEVEQTSANTVLFSVAPLRALMGSIPQIVSEISRQGHARKLRAHLAVAANPDTAILLARHFAGVTLVSSGEEASQLAKLPLESLFAHDTRLDAGLLEILRQWGLKTCEDLAGLPENAVAERLGLAGVYLRGLARGQRTRPLRIPAAETDYEEHIEVEHPIEVLEPLLFLFGRALGDLCGRLRSQSQAARLLDIRLALEGMPEYRCRLEFPIPLDESHAMLKLLQLHLERHSPAAAVMGFHLRVEPVDPRRVQGGLFLPPTPQPDQLQVTLARIAALVGEENVGTPELVNSYRPDAFRFGALDLRPFEPEPDDPRRRILRLSLRLFRPALTAQIRLADRAPKQVFAAGVRGRGIECSGPWETSGEWWAPTAWTAEEWDVALDDGALYRLACERPANTWFVVGVYD
jgi:protein ImuB